MVNPSLVSTLILTAALGFGTLGRSAAIAQSITLPAESTASLTGISTDDWSFWPSDEGRRAPERTSSGSTRDSACPGEGLVPLTPQREVGLTSQARPELLFYIPQPIPYDIEFRIASREGFAHTVRLDPLETSGIIRLPLPEAVPDLPAGKRYLWSVTFLCQEIPGPSNPMIGGRLETQATLGEAMSSVTPSLAQAARYRNDAQWYDMISMLADLQIGNPDDTSVEQAWRTVLERHGLEALLGEPIVR